jgi:cullin 3
MASEKKRPLVIKPFKPRNTMDSTAAQGIWGNLSRAIDEIHNKNASELSYEELYRNAYNVKESLRLHLEGVAESIVGATDDQLLVELSKRWGDHQVTMVMIRDILMYMDRTYVKQLSRMVVYDLGLQIFRDTIVRHDRVSRRARALALAAALLPLPRSAAAVVRDPLSRFTAACSSQRLRIVRQLRCHTQS